MLEQRARREMENGAADVVGRGQIVKSLQTLLRS